MDSALFLKHIRDAQHSLDNAVGILRDAKSEDVVEYHPVIKLVSERANLLRNSIIRKQLLEGWKHKDIADMWGLHVSRISQLKKLLLGDRNE